mmetsp:Transcript_23604/g.77674  ORF Transcript_23604/g.77674 Transcript_23604/m.77674 type:complete len:229 (-) Transcript_23604:654-1340(-)
MPPHTRANRNLYLFPRTWLSCHAHDALAARARHAAARHGAHTNTQTGGVYAARSAAARRRRRRLLRGWPRGALAAQRARQPDAAADGAADGACLVEERGREVAVQPAACLRQRDEREQHRRRREQRPRERLDADVRAPEGLAAEGLVVLARGGLERGEPVDEQEAAQRRQLRVRRARPLRESVAPRVPPSARVAPRLEVGGGDDADGGVGHRDLVLFELRDHQLAEGG